ncbi:GNAT family N-acetyltransferase [Conexibacter sp. SYSU D00693]|uniref:GNAT family N-acetyltransferase n=1 Tax=Conexibacter sp. SYSU D00693 TaxID=2812560 RepID=UPI00196B0412|nr:GNAT family N-acetyltransferase [Conexibacter sp. SYSU D00693]
MEPPPAIEVRPANEVGAEDLAAVFGDRGAAAFCRCQRYKLAPGEAFRRFPVEERVARLHEQTRCGDPDATTTSGFVALLDGEPVGWCAVEPRPAYVGLVRHAKVPWEGRDEDRGDEGVWAVSCLLVRKGFRRRGVSRAMARAAVGFARERGARALEAYPMTTTSVLAEELHVGTVSIFAGAGFAEVSRPSKRRAVMRVELDDAAPHRHAG